MGGAPGPVRRPLGEARVALAQPDPMSLGLAHLGVERAQGEPGVVGDRHLVLEVLEAAEVLPVRVLDPVRDDVRAAYAAFGHGPPSPSERSKACLR